MTREDAIRILEVNKPVMIQRVNTAARNYVEAFYMAISALKESNGEDRPKGHWIERGYVGNDEPTVDPSKWFDGMTNGEVIVSLYPNLKYTIQNGRVVTTIGVASSFDLDWWNAPYKKGK